MMLMPVFSGAVVARIVVVALHRLQYRWWSMTTKCHRNSLGILATLPWFKAAHKQVKPVWRHTVVPCAAPRAGAWTE